MAKRTTNKQPDLVRHDGGLCPNFVNTASSQRQPIRSYADLLTWGQRSGILGAADAQRLERAASERPTDAEAVFTRALELRRRLERILLALAKRRNPASADLNAIASTLGAAATAQRFVPAADGGFLLDWGDNGGDDFDRMLWPVLTSMVEVLSPASFHKVRQCAGETCTLLFVDRSPGSPRKWCRHCGNRARSRKYYRTMVKPARQKRKAKLKAAQYQRPPQPKQEDEPSASRLGASKPLNKEIA